MEDDEFARLLRDYLELPGDPNPATLDIEFVWVRDSAEFGALHMWNKHHVSENEVEEVVLEVPPCVEAKKVGDRTAFWGATRTDRWLVVICEDWNEGGKRHLKPITAFEPDEGEDYWRRL